ncbi:MAG: 3'-5' exonuclease domain-containing protein 2 [Cyclobacteriaceae bacterium]|nr:3'-5' exonuclease domain-containing protein 2 [Cyclobacteriaceae bacterium]
MTSSSPNNHNHSRLTISHEEINVLPLRAFDGKITVVTEENQLIKAVNDLQKYDVIGFDTETRPAFKKGQFYNVSLLQLAIPKKVYLIRVSHTGVTDPLIELFQNHNIIKTGVGIRDDIKALQKLNKFSAQGFEDLATLAKQVGLQVESVKKLTALILGFRISKSAQTSNWEAPALTEKQLEYAATDAWVCWELYQRLSAVKKIENE